MSQLADEIAKAVHQIASKLNDAYSQGERGLVMVRCASRSSVDRAREALNRTRAPFGWRSLPVAELDPPDLLGFALHAGKPNGPAFLAYGMPRDRDGAIDPQFLELLAGRLEQYKARPTLMVLMLTLDEMKAVSQASKEFWALRDGLVAWPSPSDAARYAPAVVKAGMERTKKGAIQNRMGAAPARPGARQLAGTFASGIRSQDAHGIVQSPDNTPWAGSPFGREDEDVPEYFRVSPAPAGRRWGRDLAPNEPELAEAIDNARQLLEDGETEVARREMAKAAKAFRELGNALACGECYVLLGRAAEIRLDHRVAYDWYKAALDVYDQIMDHAGYSDCAGFIGYLRFLHGDGDGALEAFKRAMQRDEQTEDQLRMAHGYRRLGIIAEAAMQFAQAAEQFEKAADLEEKNEDRRAYSRSLNHLARVARLTGDFDQATKLLEESIALKEELEDTHGIASGYHELGNLRLATQDLDEALEAYEKALELEVVTRDLAGLAATHAQVGLVQKERFVFKEAVRSLTIAKELFSRLNSPNADAITPVLDAAREMVDAWESRSIETEVEEWLESLIYGDNSY